MEEIDFKDRLKYALKYRNIKPIELANKLKINRAVVSQYLSGKYKPSQDRIFFIANYLEVNIGWLMGYDLPMEGEIIQENLTLDETIDLLLTTLEDPDVPREHKRELLRKILEENK